MCVVDGSRRALVVGVSVSFASSFGDWVLVRAANSACFMMSGLASGGSALALDGVALGLGLCC